MNDITIQSGLQSVLGPNIQDPNKKTGGAAPSGGAKPFGEVLTESLTESLKEVNNLQNKADAAIEDFVTGKTKNVQETMLALNKADTAFKMTMQVRNKIVEAYQEVIRMQV